MKSKYLLVLGLLFLIVALIAGCAAFLHPSGEPELGEYNYTHRPLYVGEPQRVIQVWVDKNFDNEDQVRIAKSVEAWNFVLNGHIKIEIVDTQFDMEVEKIVSQVRSNGWLIMKINSDSMLIPSSEKGFSVIGFTERVGGNHMWLVRDRLTYLSMYGVTLHEIGHLMGSDHVGQRLMYPHYTQARFQCIDFETIKEVAKWNHLPIGDLNYCIPKGDAIPVEDGKTGLSL